MSRLATHVRARPRLTGSMLVGIAIALRQPWPPSLGTRVLLGWNVSVWLYLLLVGWMMPHALPHVALALATVAGAWLLLPTIFALTYASAYCRSGQGSGLQFPGADEAFQPGYGDFLYVSFTLAVAAQTADVSISTPAMRRLVLLQSLLSFAFNTVILALTINLAVSLF